jgi:hypothetical protein
MSSARGNSSRSTALAIIPEVSRSDASYKAYVKQLIKDHIPHFKNISNNKRGRKNQVTTGTSEVSPNLVGPNGRISEINVYDSEALTKDKAYQDIQEARGYNTAKAS